MSVNLLDCDLDGLTELCMGLGEKRFRAQQLFRWIHQKGATEFGHMTDLAVSLRGKLPTTAHITGLRVINRKESSDGTVKWLFDVGQGNTVESVFIPESDRATLCISSQAGCAVGCRFCSTGFQGFSRNLTTGEIVSQLWMIEHDLRRRKQSNARVISNVVMMGMGEPLQNYTALVPALNTMLSDHAYGLSRRRVTVSTSGVVPMIERLGKDCPVALAVSLHAPTDALRSQLVPLNKKYPLSQLLGACKSYLAYAPRDFITFEYCMLAGINDSPDHAQALVELVHKNPETRLPCKINLIPFNPFPESGLTCSTPAVVKVFAEILSHAGLITTVRKTRGDDIDAACGQLAGEVQDRTHARQRLIQLVRSVEVSPVSKSPVLMTSSERNLT